MTFPSSARFSPSRRRLARRLAGLTAALATAAPASALAADVGVTAGPYVSFTFGDEIGVGWGVDTTILIAPGSSGDTCSDGLGDDDYGFGPAIQIGAINLSTFRLVGAFVGGGTIGDEDDVAFLGEAGVALHAGGAEPELGIHTGFVLQSPVYMHAFARAEWLLDEYSVGGGVRGPNLFNREATCSVGRPLRGADGLVARGLPAFVPHDRARGGAGSDERAAVGAAWADDAQAEGASVPAFLQLAAELLAHGAPEGLIARALDAAEDEIRHARLCALQASRLTGRRVVPVLPGDALRPVLGGSAGLTRLAVESWIDGCLSEGAAALRAGFGARHATDRSIAATQRAIQGDEARHAELGWDVLRWAIDRGGDGVAGAVRALRDTPPTPAEPARDEPAEAVALGRTPHAVAERLHEEQAERARRRLERLLGDTRAA